MRHLGFFLKFLPVKGNLLYQNQGILDFFLTTIFSHPGNLSVDFRNLGFFSNIGNLVFQNQGILDFFLSQQFSIMQEVVDRI